MADSSCFSFSRAVCCTHNRHLFRRAKVNVALASLSQYAVGGFRVDFGKANRSGLRFAEVMLIGADGRLLK